MTANLEGAPIDDAERIPDAEALALIYDVLIHEGLSVGTSSGINIAAAIRVAKAMGPGHTVVTILADGGARYASKLFNPAFLREKGLPVPRVDGIASGRPSQATAQRRLSRHNRPGPAICPRSAVSARPIRK